MVGFGAGAYVLSLLDRGKAVQPACGAFAPEPPEPSDAGADSGDAGNPVQDASNSGDGGNPPPPEGGCSCATTGGPVSGSAAALLVGVLFLARRKRFGFVAIVPRGLQQHAFAERRRHDRRWRERRHDRRSDHRRRRGHLRDDVHVHAGVGLVTEGGRRLGRVGRLHDADDLERPRHDRRVQRQGPARTGLVGLQDHRRWNLAARSQVDDAKVRHGHGELRGHRDRLLHADAVGRVAVEREGSLLGADHVHARRRANADRPDQRDGDAPERLRRQDDRGDRERLRDQRRRAEPRGRQVHDLRRAPRIASAARPRRCGSSSGSKIRPSTGTTRSSTWR